jgi:hypothetical protein
MKKIIITALILISQLTNANTLLNSQCSFEMIVEEISEGHLRQTQKETLKTWYGDLKQVSDNFQSRISNLKSQPNQNIGEIRSLTNARTAISALKRAKNNIIKSCMEEYLLQECVTLLSKIDFEKLGATYSSKINNLLKDGENSTSDFRRAITEIILSGSENSNNGLSIAKARATFQETADKATRIANYEMRMASSVSPRDILLKDVPESIRRIKDYDKKLAQIIQNGEGLVYKFKSTGSVLNEVEVPLDTFRQIHRNGRGALLRQVEETIQKGFVKSAKGETGIKSIKGASEKFELKFLGKRWGSKRFAICLRNGVYVLEDFLNDKTRIDNYVCH